MFMTMSFMKGLDDGRIIYATYLESIVQALRGRYVKEGCEVTKEEISGAILRYIDNSAYSGSILDNKTVLVEYNLKSLLGEVDVKRIDKTKVRFNIDSLALARLFVYLGYYKQDGSFVSLG